MDKSKDINLCRLPIIIFKHFKSYNKTTFLKMGAITENDLNQCLIFSYRKGVTIRDDKKRNFSYLAFEHFHFHREG